MTSHPTLLFHALYRAYHNAGLSRMAKAGLPDVGFPRILFALSRMVSEGAGPPSQKELADQLRISAPTIAASLKSLERGGYVSRSPDPNDTRRNLISITPRGVEALETGWEVFQWVDAYMYHGFSPEERELVASFHRRMLDNLYQIGGHREGSDCTQPPSTTLLKGCEESI